MDKSNKGHVAQAASTLLHDSKKLAHEIYQEGMHKVSEAEDSIEKHSDELLKIVQKNPLASVCIAGGIGFILAKIFK